MSQYVSDAVRLSMPMGEFQLWCEKLFYYHSPELGWRYLKDLPRSSAEPLPPKPFHVNRQAR